MSHTPGPWHWTNGTDDIDIATYNSPGFYDNPQLMAAVAPGDYIVGCDEYWTIGPVGERETQIANALLMAAAPDLLAALELFIKQWNACGPNSDFGRYFSNVRVAAEAAIKRAKP
jgi:hypothetical protein